MSEGKTAVFVGCARDCAEHLGLVLANMTSAAAAFTDVAYVFIENDSTDGTAPLLRAFGKGQKHFILEQLDGLAARHSLRTERIAEARNRYLSVIRESTLRTYDYLFVFDMDDVNSARQSREHIIRAMDFLQSNAAYAAVFANQTGCYYDMWALRLAGACPGDVWEEVFDYALAHGVPDEVAFNAT